MDFRIEFDEYIKLQYIKKLEIGQTIHTTTSVLIITLEDEELQLECDIYKGIKVLKYNEIFENMEQILNQYSPQYCKKFQNDLFTKLTQIQQEQDDEQ